VCNRFALPEPEEIAAQFEVSLPEALPPRFNIAPGEEILVVRRDAGVRVLERSTWGLSPLWLRRPGAPLLNIRAETLLGRPGRSATANQGRCLVPAGGFFEWHRIGRARQPWYFRLRDSPLFGLAAVSETAGDKVDDAVGDPRKARRRCALLTTRPNELVAPVHDRMPVIIPREAYAAWLDPGLELAELLPLLGPIAAAAMTAHPVSSLVNRTGVEDPRAIEPAARESLF